MSPSSKPTVTLLGKPFIVTALVGLALAWPLTGGPLSLSAMGALALSLVLACADAPQLGVWRRQLVTLGVVGLSALSIGQRLDAPGFGLVVLICATLPLVVVWELLNSPLLKSRPGEHKRDLGAPTALLGLVPVLAAEQVGLPRWPIAAILILLIAFAAYRQRMDLAGAQLSLVDALLLSPARLLVGSFFGIVMLGTGLLMLPAASTQPGSIALIDALFTSASATCVTGLAVLDTPHDFTRFGQFVILMLIQVGGLGMMTFATAASLYMGRRLRLREEALAAELVGGAAARTDLEAALRNVLLVTVLAEGVGAVLLSLLLVQRGVPVGEALWEGLFTSISAFCNAGFALHSDSLVSFAGNPAILAVTSALIVIGGIGPLVVVGLPELVRGRGSLHARLVLSTSLILLAVPAFAWLAIEWDNTLLGMGFLDKLSNAWFQSATLRTAGFNTVDLATVRPATWTIMILCMFVGGSPASTAGGAKTTTLAVLMVAVAAAVRGRHEAEAFGHRIPHRTVYEATAITTVGVLCVVGLLMALQLTQTLPLDHALFEAVSALATVGLSMGATAKLDDVGKLLITFAMFAGRVGPLTLFILLLGQHRPGRRFPIEAVQVG